MSGNLEAENGVLRRHKPQQKQPLADDSEVDEYQQLEEFFRNKFAQEKSPSEKPSDATKRPSTGKPARATKKKEATAGNAEELALMYKSLLDKTLANIGSMAKQPKKLTEAQIRRNKEASERLKSYHAKKKNEVVPKESEPKQPAPEPPEEEKKHVVEVPPIPQTMRNYFTDLKRKR